jgi:hypothetical protein
MPAQVRGVARDDHQVSGPGLDLLVATGAKVGLAGLRRADTAELDFARPLARGLLDQLL